MQWTHRPASRSHGPEYWVRHMFSEPPHMVYAELFVEQDWRAEYLTMPAPYRWSVDARRYTGAHDDMTAEGSTATAADARAAADAALADWIGPSPS